MNDTFYINLTADKEYQKEFITENKEELEYLGPINNVNIFVGANNSRKSRILRMLMKSTKLKTNLNNRISNIKTLNSLFDKLGNALPEEQSNSPQVNLEYLINFIDKEEGFIRFLPQTINIIKGSTNRVPFKTFLLGKSDVSAIKNKIAAFVNFNINKKDSTLTAEKILEEIILFKSKLIIINELLNLDSIPYPFTLNNRLKRFEITYPANNNTNYQIVIFHHGEIIIEYLDQINAIISLLSNIKEYIISEISVKGFSYIPILRSAISLYDKKDDVNTKQLQDIFGITTRKLYSLENVKIYTGRTLYQDIKTARNSKREVRNKFEDFEKFLSKTFFNNNKIDIVAEHNSSDINEEHIKIHFEKEVNQDRSLHEVGDGIQSLIILLFPLFMAGNEEWFFIEEPEVNLHPSMQRIFLQTITSEPDIVKKNLKVFFTTHSNHLLDISVEEHDKISIFSFEKSEKSQNKSIVRSISTLDLEILNQLGVNNSSILMANCSIWIEGHSDRKYIKGFIELYKKQFSDKFNFKEDIHYAFFEYAGSNLSHYSFDKKIDDKLSINALSLSNRILLIADEDEKKENKHEWFNKQLKEKYLTTKNFNDKEIIGGREIENLLSGNIIQKIVSQIFKQNAYELPTKQLIQGMYLDKKIGNFIRSKFKIRNSIVDNAGALNSTYKKRFAESFYELVITDKINWNELGEVAQQFCLKIIEHIKSNNGS